MRTLLFAFCALFALASVAFADGPSLWAFDVGFMWGSHEDSYLITPDPFAQRDAAYPSGGPLILESAAYDISSATLYTSGGFTPNWYSQNTISVFTGSPGGLALVSSSNAGMGIYNWLGGMECVDGGLYAIGYRNFEQGNVLLKIDNPGTASQTVTQVGLGLGDTGEMGAPFALSRDGQGGLFGSFGSFGTDLYRIDIETGEASFLRSYSGDDFDGVFEGLSFMQGSLFAMTTYGKLFEIDLGSYEIVELGELEDTSSSIWTGLVTVPEPSTLVMVSGGMLLALIARKRRP